VALIDARKVFKKFFPEAVVTADFNNMLVEGDGEGTYKQAAKTARHFVRNGLVMSIKLWEGCLAAWKYIQG
jgi:hypothetical protein